MSFKEWWQSKPAWFKGLFIGFIVLVVLYSIMFVIPEIAILASMFPTIIILPAILAIPLIFALIGWIVGKARMRNATEIQERHLGTLGIIIVILIVILLVSPIVLDCFSRYQLRERHLEPNEEQAFESACESHAYRRMDHDCNWDNVTIKEVRVFLLSSCGDYSNNKQFKERFYFCFGNGNCTSYCEVWDFEELYSNCLTSCKSDGISQNCLERCKSLKDMNSCVDDCERDANYREVGCLIESHRMIIKDCWIYQDDGIYQDDYAFCNPKLLWYKSSHCQAYSWF